MVSVIDIELKCQFLNLFGLGCLLTLLKMVDFATYNTHGNEILLPPLRLRATSHARLRLVTIAF